MNRILIVCLGLVFGLALMGDVQAADQQRANTNNFRANSSGTGPFGQREEGIFWHHGGRTGVAPEHSIPTIVHNGDGYDPFPGAQFRTVFGGNGTTTTWGDGLGLYCTSEAFIPGDAGFVVSDGADTACDTTCGNAACVAGVDAGGGGAGLSTLEDCADAGSDFCLCMNTGLDLYGFCGANWEAPALGITSIHLADGVQLAHVALLAQDIGPDMDADGFDIAGDQTANDGAELLSGMYGASGRPMWPNIDPAFYFCATVTVEDLDGTDTLWFGFRQLEAPVAAHTATTVDAYTSFVAVGLDNTSGDWHSMTCDDCSATETTTDITLSALVESEATKVCVFVSDAGVASYTVDGASATDAPAVTLDSAEPVIPFLHLLHGAAVADEVLVHLWEVGFQR